MLGLETVLRLDRSPGDHTLEVSLDGQHSIVLALLWVEVASLASRILRFLSIKLNLVWLGATTGLSHLG